MDALKEESSIIYDFCMCNPPFFANQLEAKVHRSVWILFSSSLASHVGSYEMCVLVGVSKSVLWQICHDAWNIRMNILWVDFCTAGAFLFFYILISLLLLLSFSVLGVMWYLIFPCLLLCSLSSPLLSPSLSLSLPAVLLSLLSASAQTAQMKQVVGVNATLPCHHQYWQSSDSLDIEWILHKPNSKHRVVRDNLSSSSVLLLLSLSFPLCLSLSLSDVSFPYAFFCQSSHLSHSLLPPCLSYWFIRSLVDIAVLSQLPLPFFRHISLCCVRHSSTQTAPLTTGVYIYMTQSFAKALSSLPFFALNLAHAPVISVTFFTSLSYFTSSSLPLIY